MASFKMLDAKVYVTDFLAHRRKRRRDASLEGFCEKIYHKMDILIEQIKQCDVEIMGHAGAGEDIRGQAQEMDTLIQDSENNDSAGRCCEAGQSNDASEDVCDTEMNNMILDRENQEGAGRCGEAGPSKGASDNEKNSWKIYGKDDHEVIGKSDEIEFFSDESEDEAREEQIEGVNPSPESTGGTGRSTEVCKEDLQDNDRPKKRDHNNQGGQHWRSRIFSSLEQEYHLPLDRKCNYKTLNKLEITGRLEYGFGVVTDFSTIKKSRGSDLTMSINIMDPTYNAEPRSICLFYPTVYQFPEVYAIGDILRFHRLKATTKYYPLQLISNKATSLAVFPGSGDKPVTLESARSYTWNDPYFSNVSAVAVEYLRQWSHLNSHLIRPTKFTTVSEVGEGHYNLWSTVVRAETKEKPWLSWRLTIYDGTSPQPPSAEFVGDARKERRHYRTVWDKTESLDRDKLVYVYVEDDHAELLTSLPMDVVQVAIIYGALSQRDAEGRLFLFLSRGSQDDGFRGIRLVNPKSNIGRQMINTFRGNR